MSAIKLATPSSGSISLSPADTASNLTITVPAVTGTMITTGSTFAGTGPAFSAYPSGQNVANNTWTKVQFNTEEFDTNSNFDTSTYRFTPTVAGYYQINAAVYYGFTNSWSASRLYKNGSGYRYGSTPTSNANGSYASLSTIVYMNGTTDYLEFYTYQSSGSGQNLNADAGSTFFQGVLVRAA